LSKLKKNDMLRFSCRQYLNLLFFLVLCIGFVIGCSNRFDLTKAPTSGNRHEYELLINSNAPSNEAFIALQRLTEPYLNQKDWVNVISTYQQYNDLFPGSAMQKKIQKIIGILEAEEEGLLLTNLEFSINTAADEYSPVLSLDEKRLYFTGRDRVGGYGGEDIFYSDYIDDQWQSARNIGKSINTRRGNESLDAISPDGSKLLLWGNYSGSLGNGDIFYVDRNEKGWSEIKHFPSPINSGYFEGNAYITADGNAILFTSDRPEGIGEYNPKGMLFNGGYMGNTDIYVTIKTRTGWSDPINLGLTINTPYAEYSPFLHPDGKTLYFSSDGHPGLGRMDVFKSERLDMNSWTKWSEPVNLGKEINTAENDWAYRISLSGEIAYFATAGKHNSMSNYNIYTISMPEEVRPEPVTVVKGKVIDQNGNPLYADIDWRDRITGVIVGKIKTDPVDGTYAIILEPDKEYDYEVSKKGYLPVNNSLKTVEQNEEFLIIEIDEIELISLDEIKIKEMAITINNIFFEFNDFKLLPISYVELDRLSKLLMENPEYAVEIHGHTDNVGTATYNKLLSKKRAQSVVDYLISVGCDHRKLKAKGFGFDYPIDTNDTEEGRSKNRRVEFILY
jgi:outer membrane protein OmpA-like peptidoglycan-associated protein